MFKIPIHILHLKVIFVLTCALCFSQYAFSQSDTSYVKPFTHPLSLQTYFSDSFTTLAHVVGDGDEVRYRPNNPFGIGLGFSYKNISLSGSYGFDFMRDKKKGKTKSLDLQYHRYARKYTVDIFFQNYKGFYAEDEEIEGGEQTYKHYSDIKLVQYGAFVQYVFNGNKFSYEAAFNQNERQLKSAGSFLLGVGGYYNYARSDSSFVFTNNRNEMKNVQFGVSAGYAYTWVASPRFYVSGSISVGANFGAENIDRFGKERLKIYPTVFPRFSMGYNHDDWSLGLSAIVNRVYLDFSESSSMSFDTGAIQMTFIKRFSILPKFMREKDKK